MKLLIYLNKLWLGSRFVGLHNTPTEHHSRTENIGGTHSIRANEYMTISFD